MQGKQSEVQTTLIGKGVPKVLDYNCPFAMVMYDKGRMQLNINSFTFLQQVILEKKLKMNSATTLSL